MRKLFMGALIAGLAVLSFSTAASATSVDFGFYNGASGINVTGGGYTYSGNSITLDPSASATFTLELTITTPAVGGFGAFFLSFEFDTDLGDELNYLLGYQIPTPTVGGSVFVPIQSDFAATQYTESSGGSLGQLAQWEANGTYTGGVTTFLVGLMVFETNHGNVTTDGNDLLTGADIKAKGGQATVLFDSTGAGNITSSVTFGGMSVNLVPEPGTLSLVGLGVGMLVLAGRQRRRK